MEGTGKSRVIAALRGAPRGLDCAGIAARVGLEHREAWSLLAALYKARAVVKVNGRRGRVTRFAVRWALRSERAPDLAPVRTDPELVTAREAGLLTGRAFKTVTHWALAGHLASVGRASSGAHLYRRADVLAVSARMDADPKTAAIRKARNAAHEPTEAELERTIAEQMQCLPRWWRRDAESRTAPPTIRLVVLPNGAAEALRLKETRRGA